MLSVSGGATTSPSSTEAPTARRPRRNADYEQ